MALHVLSRTEVAGFPFYQYDPSLVFNEGKPKASCYFLDLLYDAHHLHS
jgi:hypothetical protein